MTMDDAFDERLKAAFAKAAEPLEREEASDAFTHGVMQRLSHPNRKRVLLLGGAGSTGSAIAGSQLEGVMGNLQMPTDGAWATVGLLMTPEALAAAAMAVTLGLVATILPRRLI